MERDVISFGQQVVRKQNELVYLGILTCNPVSPSLGAYIEVWASVPDTLKKSKFHL
jgi:hypothetical protein